MPATSVGAATPPTRRGAELNRDGNTADNANLILSGSASVGSKVYRDLTGAETTPMTWPSLERVRETEERLAELESEAARRAPAAINDLGELAADFQSVWDAPGTDVRLKKRLLRTLIQEIVVDTDSSAGETLLLIHWRGGVHTELRVKRRKHGSNRLHTPPETIEVVRLLNRICDDVIIAGVLNRAGLRTGRGNRWNANRVKSMRDHFEIPAYTPERQQIEGWLNLSDAANQLGVAPPRSASASSKAFSRRIIRSRKAHGFFIAINWRHRGRNGWFAAPNASGQEERKQSAAANPGFFRGKL
jgi:hypothetical protein